MAKATTVKKAAAKKPVVKKAAARPSAFEQKLREVRQRGEALSSDINALLMRLS